jgi:hypothetical protein
VFQGFSSEIRAAVVSWHCPPVLRTGLLKFFLASPS